MHRPSNAARLSLRAASLTGAALHARSGAVVIEIDEIELLPFSSITDEDLTQTGEPDVETLRRRTAHSGPIHDDTIVYRVEFHVVGQLDNKSG